MNEMLTIRRWVVLAGIILLSNISRAQQMGCNYKAGDITFQLIGQSQGSNIVSQIVLVDGGDIIRYKSLPNQTTISNVFGGSYKAIAITYDQTQSPLPVIETGSNITLVGNCLKSIPVTISVCDCNTNINEITANIPVTGTTQQFVLTNGKGVIQKVSSKAHFEGLTNGVYNLYSVCGSAESIQNVVVGGNIRNLPTENLCMATPLSYVVCLPDCKSELCLPFIVVKRKYVSR